MRDIPYGFHGKILDIDLSRSKIKVLEFDEEVYREFIGGRGLATYILWKEFGLDWSKVNPLGPENLLIILTGPLTGFWPGGSRVCISGKSPQSLGIIGSTVDSDVGVELKASGYDGIIIRGASKDPVYLFIYNDNIEIRDASHIWGLKGSEIINWIMKDIYNELKSLEKNKGLPSHPGYLYIGPAGESMVRCAAVISRRSHGAGYGGYGAVMGSKKLKAIVVKGCNPLPEVYDKDGYKDMLYRLWKFIGEKGRRFREWGTAAGGYVVGAETSSEPIRNWQSEWHNNKRVHVSEYQYYWMRHRWGCYGCPISCMKISYTNCRWLGKVVTDGPDYEAQAYLGTNLGVFNPRDNICLTALADELGFDSIGTGNLLGFIAELFEKDIISEKDLGFKVEWGNAESFAKLMKLIIERKGLGNIFAEGTYRAALAISKIKGVDVTKYAVTVKGVAVGAHGVRSCLDYTKPISYAVSVQCGDHTSTAKLDYESGEPIAIFHDSAVICSFTAFHVSFEDQLRFLNVVTGWNLNKDVWLNVKARRILFLQRIMLLLGGPDIYWDPRIHDDVPPRFYEPLPEGPYKGKKIDRSEVMRQRIEYYRRVGYDEYGIPRAEELKSLGLNDAIEAVKIIKERLRT